MAIFFFKFILGKYFKSGVPDDLFSNQTLQFRLILVGLAMENLGIFYDHLVYFTAIGNILWPFGMFDVLWYIFSVLVFCTMKNLATLFQM
jgi:hypothetical protein